MSGLTAGQLLTAEQVAERWQVPRSQVYRLTRNDRIPAVKLGKYYRYRLDAIEAFELGGDAGAEAGADGTMQGNASGPAVRKHPGP